MSLPAEGSRIELVYTDDRYTRLRPGSQGTVRGHFVNMGHDELLMTWDDGSTLSMIPDSGDRWKVIEEVP